MAERINWRTVAEEPLQVSADELEAAIAKDSDDLRARVQLIRHYLPRLFEPEAQARRNAHIHWLILHHPEVGLDGYACISANLCPDAYEQGKQHWLSVVEQQPDHPIILRHASEFLFMQDRALAEDLIRRGASLEPASAYWRECLGVLRRLDWHDVRSADEQRRFARDALAEYERALELEDAPARRFPLLIEIAKAASKAGKHDRASEVATTIFATEPELVGTFTYNRAIHFAHIALGNRALAGGDVTSAREHLFAAGSTNANFAAGEMYGPDFTLAAALLTHGERDAVIDYLAACKGRWPYDRHLESWRRCVEDADVPSFRITDGTPR